MEWELGAPGKAYTAWAAQMAVAQKTGVPWVMCKQDDAPDPIVSKSALLSFFIYFCRFPHNPRFLMSFCLWLSLGRFYYGGFCYFNCLTLFWFFNY